MLEDKLRSLLIQKARMLNLAFDDVEIVPLNPEQDELISFNAEMFVDIQDGVIRLEVADVGSVPEDDLELMVEHEICHCKDYEEAIYGVEVFAPGTTLIQAVAQEMYQAYTEYFASKRQIREFGMERFVKYQMRGMKEFLERTDAHIRQDPEPEHRYLFVASYYKEQIKCDLMEDDASQIPDVIKDITAPFEESFEIIHRSGLDWINKSKLLYLMVVVGNTNIDPTQSYLDGQLTPSNGLKSGISQFMLGKGIFDHQTYIVGLEIEKLMLNKYAEITQMSQPQ